MTIIALLISGLLLVACGADEEGGGGLTDGTPMGTEQVPGLEGEATPTEEITGTEEVTGTVEVTETATVEATEEPAEEPTEEATGEATEDPSAGEEGEETVIMRAGELMDMPIQDDAGAEIGFVAEVLVDDSGAIQYVVVDVLPAQASGSAESAYPGVEETTQPTQTEQTVERTFISVPWDAFQVETAEAPDAASETEDEGADAQETPESEGTPESEETTAGEAEAERGEVTLVYAGDTALEEQQTFNVEILDEQGYVLDDQGEGDVSVPAEYTGLLQLSDHGDYEIVNTADEELGSGAEVLVNLSEGRVAYLVVDVGGFLGIGANSVPIPWDSAQLEVTVEDGTETEVFRVDADEATLEEAPTVELDNWTPQVESGWDAEFRDYWQSDTTTG